jgi:ribosomal protein S18 acetylase RimI-like enzyme
MGKLLPDRYQLKLGSTKDSNLLANFMQLAYQELFPDRQNFSHLLSTVEKYLHSNTPLWWVKAPGRLSSNCSYIGCLWIGKAQDQVTGEDSAYIFLLYVNPKHRRLGIGKALMEEGTNWAIAKKYNQITLQVFTDNQIALNLYQNLGFKPQSLLLSKNLTQN